MIKPSLFDTVTGLRFIGVTWPRREGQPLSLPQSRSLDSLVGSILRFNNLDPSVEDGSSISYTIGPSALAIDIQRTRNVDGLQRIDNVKVALPGVARVPKTDRFTGMAKGFEMSRQNGIAMGTSVEFPDNPGLNYEQVATFSLPKKSFSNHILSKVLVKGNPNKLAALMQLEGLYVSSPVGFEANQRQLFDKGILTFSPVNMAQPTQDRTAFMESSLVANTFFQSNWWL